MKIDERIQSGLKVMIAIASEPNGMLQKNIANNLNIPIRNLDDILSALRLKGLIADSKDNEGCYKLARTADEITMWDIYTAFEPIVIVGCVNNNLFCKMFCDCIAKDYWPEFKAEFEEILLKKNLYQIIKKTIK